MSDTLPSSTVVFRARAAELNMEESAVEKAIKEGIGTLGQFGFSSKFCPDKRTKLLSGILLNSCTAWKLTRKSQ